MKGIQESFVYDMFKVSETKYKAKKYKFAITFFEIYGGRLFSILFTNFSFCFHKIAKLFFYLNKIINYRCYDCLNEKAPLTIMEDKNNNVQIPGLLEKSATTP